MATPIGRPVNPTYTAPAQQPVRVSPSDSETAVNTPSKKQNTQESFNAARQSVVGKTTEIVNPSKGGEQIKLGISQTDDEQMQDQKLSLMEKSQIMQEFSELSSAQPSPTSQSSPSVIPPSVQHQVEVSTITNDMLVQSRQNLRPVSQHQVLNLEKTDTAVTESSRSIILKDHGSAFAPERLTAKSTLEIVGHGSPDGASIGGLSPKLLALRLKSEGIRQLAVLDLKSCYSDSFKISLEGELKLAGIQVGEIRTYTGQIAISRETGKALMGQSVKAIQEHDGLLGDIKKLGGKGAGLEDLQEFCANLDDETVRVPGFFVVETGVYNKFVATNVGNVPLTLVRNQLFPEGMPVDGLTRNDLPDNVLDTLKDKTIVEMGQAIAVMNEPQRAHCAKLLVKLINSSHMFNAIKDTEEGLAIKSQYSEKFGNKTVAVRSSGTMEDGSKDSAAGLYKSLLGNKGQDAVLKAVLETISSNFEPKVFVHRQNYGQDISQSRMACVIQEVFEPQFAGVGFSLNPVNPHEITINFAEGLGEFVVGSHGQPAKVTYNRLTKEFSYENGLAKFKYALNEDKDRVDKIPFPQEKLIDATALGNMAEKLADIVDKMEQHFKRPVDMEFGINLETGELALLQQRTVTVTGTTSFSDIGQLNEQVHVDSKAIFSGGVAKGSLIHIANPKTFDYSSLAPTDIVVVTNFTDEIEANINKFAGYISLNGGDLDHGAIVLRQHNKVAMRVSQEQFANLIEHDLNKEVTLAVGKFSGVSSGKVFLGDKKAALEDKATHETDLKTWSSSVGNLAKDLEAIKYPANLDTAQNMGSMLKSMVSLNARLLKCFHPEQGGAMGKFLDTDPFFFTTQDLDKQLENTATVQNELGMFLIGMKDFVGGYVSEVDKLNPDSQVVVTQEKKLLTHLNSIHKEIDEAFVVLNDKEKGFRERATAMQTIKDKLLKLDHNQGDIMNGNPDGLVSTHEIIIRVHRNMFEQLKNIKQGYPAVETQGLVGGLKLKLPQFDQIGIQPIQEDFHGGKLNLVSVTKHPEQDDDITHISGNIKTVLGLKFDSFEQAMTTPYQPEHLSGLIGQSVQIAGASIFSEPTSLPLIQNWLGKMDLVDGPTELHVQTEVHGLLNAAADKIMTALLQKGLNEYSFDETFLTDLKAKLVDQGKPLTKELLKETLREKLYSQTDMPGEEDLAEIIDLKNLNLPDSVTLANRLARNLKWDNDSQDEDFNTNFNKLALKVINEKVGPILLSEFAQGPLHPQDHSVTQLVDNLEPWHMDMMKQLPSLSKGSVVLTDGALVADIPLGSHSMEMMAVQDKDKGGDANYLSVRYVDNTKGTGLTRAHIYMEFFKKCFNVDEISYEQESQGLRFKIPNINYEDKTSLLYIGRVTQIMKQVFDSSNDLDFVLDIVGKLPEFSKEQEAERIKSFSDVNSGKAKLGENSQAFIESLTNVMKTVSEDLLKRNQPHPLNLRRMLTQLFTDVPLGD